MRDHHRPKQELVNEVVALRKQVADLREAMIGRQRIEDALRHSEQQLRTLLDGCPAGLCLLRSDGTVTATNRRFAQLLGYESVVEVLAVGNVAGVFAAREEQERVVECSQAGGFSGEVRLRRKEGGSQTAWVSGAMLENRNGIALVIVENFSAAWLSGTRSASGRRSA
jgi:PAS domain S-box-containing protein